MVDYDDVLKEVEREEKVDSATEYLEKTKRIEKEVRRLKRLFKDIDENKKKLVFATIDDVAFMTITMQDLRETIVREGTTCEYKNGANQYGTKQSPAAQMYLQMILDCMPKAQKEPVKQEDDFKDFVGGRGT